MASPGESYLQISSVLCAVSCTISPSTLLPDCSTSGKNCCSPDPLNCFSFYTCNSENQPQQAFCGPLQTFNNTTLSCDENGETCYPKCAKRCQTDENGSPLCENNISCCLPNPDNCKYFYTCSNKNVGVAECPVGSGFDEVQLECSKNEQCFQSEQQCKRLCAENAMQCLNDCCGPLLETCSSQYYRCINGTRAISTCPVNTIFNQTLLACDSGTYKNCKQETDKTVTECLPDVTNPAVTLKPTTPTSSPLMPTTTTTTTTTRGGPSDLENRRLLTRDEFLSIIYSVYRELGEKFSAPI